MNYDIMKSSYFSCGGEQMKNGKVVTIEDRIPKLKAERRRKANRRLIIYLSLFFLLILLVVYLQSPLSKIGIIEVEGNHYVPESQILYASQLSSETNFWNFNTEDVAKKILESNVQLADVSIHRRLPQTVQIEVKEFARVAYLKQDDVFFPILENGEIIEMLPEDHHPVNAPILENVDEEKLDELASELYELPQSMIQRISEITFTSSDTISYDLTVYMNDGYEVRTCVTNFAENMKKYPAIVSEIEPGKRGIIHLNVSSYFEEYGSESEEDVELEGEG